MNAEECAKVMMFMSAAIDRDSDKDINDATLEVYFQMLKDLPYELVFAGAKKVIAESVYPTLPTVGAIKQAVRELEKLTKPCAEEAWGLVQEAMHERWTDAGQELRKALPETAKKVIEIMGWLPMVESTKPDIMRAQFIKYYEKIENREEQKKLLTGDVRALIENGQNQSSLPDTPSGEEKGEEIAEADEEGS